MGADAFLTSGDRAVREAAKQIRAIPGGIILDISASDLSVEEIEAAIGQRIPVVAAVDDGLYGFDGFFIHMKFPLA